MDVAPFGTNPRPRSYYGSRDQRRPMTSQQTNSDRNDRRTGHTGRNGGPSLPINRRAVSVRSFPLTALFCIAVLASLYVARDVFVPQIGRASCRERVCQYV